MKFLKAIVCGSGDHGSRGIGIREIRDINIQEALGRLVPVLVLALVLVLVQRQADKR